MTEKTGWTAKQTFTSIHFLVSGYPDQIIQSNLNLSVALSDYSQWKLLDNRNSNATAFSFSNGTDTTVNSSYYLTAGHFVSPSDSRLKINFKTISGTVLTDFTNIMVGTWNKQYKVIYNKKTKNNEITNESYDVVTQVGVLADSLPKLYSSVDNSGIYSIDSVKLYALFVKAVQELYENQKLIAVKLNIKLKY